MMLRRFVPALAFLAMAASAPAADPPKASCTSAESRQFDFWIGDWSVTDESGKPLGSNRITSILSGCVLLEEWSGGGGGNGKSFNVWVAEERFWRQTWVDDKGGTLILTGTFHDGTMDLAGERPDPKDPSKRVRSRITWEKLGDGRVRQVWKTSRDGGASWITAFDGFYARKATGKG